MSESDTYRYLPAFVNKMSQARLPGQVIDLFKHYYKKTVNGEKGLIFENKIKPLKNGEIKTFESLPAYAAEGRSVLQKTVAITLNGGLGTSMGLTGPKSLVPAKDGKTFLELILRQAQAHGIRPAFMNSYNTHDDTVAAIHNTRPDMAPSHFIQNKFPKILQSDFSPALCPENPDMEWNPPGHGDLYLALSASGLLDHLVKNGIQYAFVSNCDNLGAGIETALLGYLAKHDFPFMMEVSRRTPSDMKGGHLARMNNGCLVLREAAQCPEGEKAIFSDIDRYCFFNTNNLWLNLPAIQNYIRDHGMLTLPMILNAKTLDPRNPDSAPVFQVESAMGAAISLFPDAEAVQVPRSRFLPVKKCSDLLAIRSDCYQLASDGRLILNPDRTLPHDLKVTLDPAYYGHLDQFDNRFSRGIPSLINCTSLEISGDVYFGENITISGDVKITNTTGAPRTVAAGTHITNDISF